MPSPFEQFTQPSQAFDDKATAITNTISTMAEEDAPLTIAFLMATIIMTAIHHEITPRAVAQEFRRAIASFSRELAAPETEH